MDEEKALELYSFFNEEGYDLGEEENFLNALQDETKRVELFDFFEKEGYDIGVVDNFTLKKKTILNLLGGRKLWYPIQKWWTNVAHRSLLFK
jgi:hypothetical protein